MNEEQLNLKQKCQRCNGTGSRELTEMRICGANYEEIVIGYKQCCDCCGAGYMKQLQTGKIIQL